jgi:glycosyltransferase involved in cell wall biosynthesis
MILRRLLMPWVITLADVVMTTGAGVARAHPGAETLGSRLVPFYPPVDTSLFTVDPVRRAAARAELGVEAEELLVGTVANLNPQKGLEHFVALADALHAAHPDVHFAVLGSAMETQEAYATSIRRLVDASSACRAGMLRLEDPGERVPHLLPAFDLFVMTSVPRSEGISTTVLEAMACGIPVVSTDVGALSEVVIDSVVGRLVPALNDDLMVEVVGEILTDAERRARMATEARRRAVEFYDVQRCAGAHLRAYERAAMPARRRSSAGTKP